MICGRPDQPFQYFNSCYIFITLVRLVVVQKRDFSGSFFPAPKILRPFSPLSLIRLNAKPEINKVYLSCCLGSQELGSHLVSDSEANFRRYVPRVDFVRLRRFDAKVDRRSVERLDRRRRLPIRTAPICTLNTSSCTWNS